MSPQNRRDFLKTSALAGLGVAAVGCGTSVFTRGPAATPGIPAGPVGLALTGAVDDAMALVRADPATGAALRSALRQNVDLELPGNVALTAGGPRTTPRAVVGVIGRYRDGRPHDDAEAAELRLGFALGWLAFRAADRELGQVYAGPDGRGEAGVYLDAAVLRGRSGGRAGGPVEPVESLFQTVGARMLIRFHTLNPDYDDVPGWVGRLAEHRRERFDYLGRLAEAYQDPDPAKLRRYVTGPQAYDADDAPVRAVRAVRGGAPADLAEVTGEPARSRYGRAVQAAARQLEAAGAFLDGDLDELGLVAVVAG